MTSEIEFERRLLDFGYAPGGYLCHCRACNARFDGDKRAYTCRECAKKSFDVKLSEPTTSTKSQPDMILRAEVAALRAQFHTQAEQRDFIGKLVDNMPHAQIAAEFEEFKAEVADALAALRKKVVALQLPVGHVEYSQYDYGVGDALNCVDTTIAKLGLAPKEKQ